MASEGSVMAVIRASRPCFRNPHDKLAFAVHSAFLASGYSLSATGTSASASSSGEEEVGTEGWNEFEDSYGFVYVVVGENGVKKKVVVKCLVIEDVLTVDAVNVTDDDAKEPLHLQLNVKDYVSGDAIGTSNYKDMYKNFAGLVDSLKVGILDKLEQKKTPPKVAGSSADAGHERSDPSVTGPTIGIPMEPQPYRDVLVYPPIPSSGFDDVNPGPGAGVFPDRGHFGEGGMLVGPNDPRWMGAGGMEGGYPGGPGGFGGVPGVPPGARFDPYGPPGVPGFEPSRFLRQPPRRPGGGTHPDLPHFQGPDYI